MHPVRERTHSPQQWSPARGCSTRAGDAAYAVELVDCGREPHAPVKRHEKKRPSMPRGDQQANSNVGGMRERGQSGTYARTPRRGRATTAFPSRPAVPGAFHSLTCSAMERQFWISGGTGRVFSWAVDGRPVALSVCENFCDKGGESVVHKNLAGALSKKCQQPLHAPA